jgi:phosphatidylinositol-3-phosphatase
MSVKSILSCVFAFLAISLSSSAQVPRFGHVFIVVEENTSYADVIGKSAMPYLNSLANTYGMATNYYANTHPSIGNYMMLVTGEEVTNQDQFVGTVDVDNIVRQLVAAGKTWKCYAEDLPSAGYLAGDVSPYLKRHNPFSYLSDVVGSPQQQQNLVPFPQFAADLSAGSLPDYSFIVPNAYDDAHNCPAGMSGCTTAEKLAIADTWLRTNIDPLVNSALFQADGLLVIVFDEAGTNDTTNGGGHVAAVVVSPKVKSSAYRARDLYQHQDVLRLVAEGLGLTSFPGASATASNMAQFFATPSFSCPAKSTATPAISFCAPSDGATLTAPMRLFALVLMNTTVASLQLSVDGVVSALPAGDRVNKQLSLAPGKHVLTVQAAGQSSGTSAPAASSTITVNIVPK